jgi:hypothetical protein
MVMTAPPTAVPAVDQDLLDLINAGPRMYTIDGHCPEGDSCCTHTYSHLAAAAAADLDNVPVWCTTCDGRGRSIYRGDSHETYDDPDYEDTCAICGGEQTLRASMFSTAPENEPDYEDEPDYHDDI